MKVKKLLALVLSALMAVTMLAACGGGGEGTGSSGIGGSSGNALDIDKVNAFIVASGSNAYTHNSSELNGALRATITQIERLNAFAPLSTSLELEDQRQYPITNTNITTGKFSYTDGDATVISEADLLKSGMSLEEAAANWVLGGAANPDYKGYMEHGAEFSWYVSAMRGTSNRDGQHYWFIGYEVTIKGSI